MKISKKQIDRWVVEAIETVPKRFFKRMHNLVFAVDDRPTREQLKTCGLKRGYSLYGLYEGREQNGGGEYFYAPDKISIFREAVISGARTIRTVKRRVYATVWHEISHHFGSDEDGAKRAEKRMFERYSRLSRTFRVQKKEVRKKTFQVGGFRRSHKRKTKVTCRVKPAR